MFKTIAHSYSSNLLNYCHLLNTVEVPNFKTLVNLSSAEERIQRRFKCSKLHLYDIELFGNFFKTIAMF